MGLCMGMMEINMLGYILCQCRFDMKKRMNVTPTVSKGIWVQNETKMGVVTI